MLNDSILKQYHTLCINSKSNTSDIKDIKHEINK